MASGENEGGPLSKRRKINIDPLREVSTTTTHCTSKGIDRPISPPLSRRGESLGTTVPYTPTWSFDGLPRETSATTSPETVSNAKDPVSLDFERAGSNKTRYISSPIQLTRIQDLGADQNVDTVGLKDLLGDPLIKECWNFNYLFDLDFVM